VVDGRRTEVKQLRLAVLVQGARGSAQGSVGVSEGGAAGRSVQIQVSLPGGRVVDVRPGGGGGGGPGDVIDVDVL